MTEGPNIKIEIPLRPVPLNQAYRTWKGKILKSAKAKEFQNQASAYIIDQATRLYSKEHKLRVLIKVQYKTRRQVDVDSCLKLLLDTLEGVVMENDNQIYDLRVMKTIGCDENHISIEIEEMET